MEFPWTTQPVSKLATLLQSHVDTLDVAHRERLVTDADRVGAIAHDAGQSAIFSVTSNEATLDQLPNGYARGTWLLLNAPRELEAAEQVQFADDRRYGRMWDGFVGEPGHSVARDGDLLERFRLAWRETSGSTNVEVEVCDRCRPRLGEADQTLVQVAVYREGRTSERKTFVDGRLDRQSDRPVIEAAVTYEPATGVIEVVATSREVRQKLAPIFAECLLSAPFSGERIRIRQYALGSLKRASAFPTDPEDNIETVRVIVLRLKPLDTASERVTLECMRSAERTIWDTSAARFGEHDPLRGGWAITQAKLVIKFRATSGSHARQTLPVTITMPQGCDLKDRTEREMLIGTKYLRRWGLLRDV